MNDTYYATPPRGSSCLEAAHGFRKPLPQRRLNQTQLYEGNDNQPGRSPLDIPAPPIVGHAVRQIRQRQKVRVIMTVTAMNCQQADIEWLERMRAMA